MRIHEILKALRIERNLRQEALSENLNVSRSIISEWESGKKKPGAEAIIALAKFFDVPTDYILGVDTDLDAYKQRVPNPDNNKNRYKIMQKLNELDIETLSDEELSFLINLNITAVKELRKLKD